MKKASIFLSIALIVLMVFAGCENSNPYPKFLTDAQLAQTGDFLVGQSFDSSKFQVTAIYMDGSKETYTGATITTNSKDGRVYDGTLITADLGDTYYATSLKRELEVSAYEISRLEVTSRSGNTQYVVSNDVVDIPESDLIVSAYYVKNGVEVATPMILSGSEYKVESNYTESDAKVSTAVPSVNVVATVTPLIGFDGCESGNESPITASFAYTAVISDEIAEVVDVTSATINAGRVLAALEYDEVPEPTAEDVKLDVIKADGTSDTVQASSELVTMYYVTEDGIRLDEADLTDMVGDKLSIKVFYNDEEVKVDATNKVTVTASSLRVTLRNNFNYAAYVRGEDLPAVDVSTINVDLLVGEEVDHRLTAKELADVEFKYQSNGTDVITEVPATGNVYIFAEYMGAHTTYKASNDNTCGVIEGAKIEAAMSLDPATISVALRSGFVGPYKQNYYSTDDMPVITTDDVIVTVKNAKGEDISSTGTYTVVYSTTPATAITESKPTVIYPTTLPGAAHLYAFVTYTGAGANKTPFTASVEVPMRDAVINALNVVVTYDKVVGDDKDTPLYGATPSIAVYAVANDEGYVHELTSSDYVIVGDDGKSTSMATVGAEAVTYTVKAYVNGSIIPSEPVVIPAGVVGYTLEEPAEKVTVTFDNDDVFAALDTPLSAVLDLENFTVSGYTKPYDEAPDLVVEKVLAATENIDDTNVVKAYVSYVDADGNEQTDVVDVTITGDAWIETSGNLHLADSVTGKAITQFEKTGEITLGTEVGVLPADYILHGETSILISASDRGNTPVENGHKIMVYGDSVITFTYKWTAADGTTKTATQVINGPDL